jgi:hypothetical protein
VPGEAEIAVGVIFIYELKNFIAPIGIVGRG